MGKRIDSRSGFTLLEAVIGLAIFTIVVGVAVSVALTSGRSFESQMQQYSIEQAGRRALDRLSSEFRHASMSTISPQPLVDSPRIEMQKVFGYQGGAALLGPLTTLEFQLVPDESPNNADDNGDGRVDEGLIVYTEQGADPIPLIGNVMGLRFTQTATGVSFSIDVALFSRDGGLVEKTFTGEIAFRNAF